MKGGKKGAKKRGGMAALEEAFQDAVKVEEPFTAMKGGKKGGKKRGGECKCRDDDGNVCTPEASENFPDIEQEQYETEEQLSNEDEKSNEIPGGKGSKKKGAKKPKKVSKKKKGGAELFANQLQDLRDAVANF